MIFVLFMLLSILAFPAIIFLDYHKKQNIHKAIRFIVFFFAVMFIIAWCVKTLGLSLVYFLLLIPIILFGVLIVKNWKRN